jgi:pyroglutamyl-peptidase
MNEKILITGFEPFGSQKINPSQIMIEHLKKNSNISEMCDFLLLPVDYVRAAEALTLRLKTQKWAGWIGFGQAGGRDKISLERVALNWKEKDFNQADVQPPARGPLIEGAENAFINPMDLVKILVELKRNKIPSEISFTAGTYICNCVYYFAMRTFQELNSNSFSLFVHVPYLPEQSQNSATMSLGQMLKAAEIIIHQSIHQSKEA